MSIHSSVGIITSSAPFGAFAGKDAQDLALIMGSYEQNVSLYFIGDGVFHLLTCQEPNSINAKDYLSTFNALEFYDIEQVYVCAQSLKDRSLTTKDLFLESVKTLSTSEFAANLKNNKAVFNF